MNNKRHSLTATAIPRDQYVQLFEALSDGKVGVRGWAAPEPALPQALVLEYLLAVPNQNDEEGGRKADGVHKEGHDGSWTQGLLGTPGLWGQHPVPRTTYKQGSGAGTREEVGGGGGPND